MEKRSFRLGIKQKIMNIENKNKLIPEEFKKLAENFANDGFITTSLE